MMRKNSITIKNSVFVKSSPEKLWDYTQDYANRTQWDPAIVEAAVLETSPARVVQLKARGNSTMSFIYKLDQRPHKTSLVAKEIRPAWIISGGGSWTYEAQNGGTLWSQTNTIVFKDNLILRLLRPVFKWIFTLQTEYAMRKAKKIIESR